MDGILLVDKPSGWTSFDVVARVRGILRTGSNQLPVTSSQSTQATGHRPQATSSRKVKVGHTGTLDPLATGLLVLLIGDYCKRAQEFSRLDKTYEVTMRLGRTSTTGDEEGEKTVISNKEPEIRELQAAIKQFNGEITQTPPAYSAIKVDGQRAYKLARAGKEVKLEPRPVTIYSLKITDYHYPEVKFTAKVSSGTYIRSLVEDVGKVLKTGAYMSALRRTSVGNFSLEKATQINGLAADVVAARLLTT